MNNCIAVTGANGFVGCSLVPYLEKAGYKIFPIVRSPALDQYHNSVSYDCFNKSYIDLNKITAIIHLAGKAHDLKKSTDDNDYLKINTQLTEKTYDTFLASKASLFIYISSTKAVSDHAITTITEDLIPAPKTRYGISKWKAEEYIKSKPLFANKKYIILRPCMIHGPGNKGNLNLLYKFIEKRIPYPLGAFQNKRSFLSIDNFCFVVNEIINSTMIQSGIYNIADDEPLSTNELIIEISKALGRRAKIWKVKKNIINWVAKFSDKFHLPLNSEHLGKLTETYIVSNSKLVNTLQITLPFTTREGIQKTIKSFRNFL
jgi:nucleoside-diphosphate-sugar epimerase